MYCYQRLISLEYPLFILKIRIKILKGTEEPTEIDYFLIVNRYVVNFIRFVL